MSNNKPNVKKKVTVLIEKQVIQKYLLASEEK